MRSLLQWFFVAIVLGSGGAGCRQAVNERAFTVQGVVVSPVSEGEIVIEHEEIPGFMPAMTMPFFVAQPVTPEVRALRPGDVVRFEFRVGDTSSASRFEVLGRAPATPPDSTRLQAPAARASRLRPGDRLTSLDLVDQNGARLSLEQLAGSYTVLTFIFTRCPVPEFCPRVSAEFQKLQHRLETAGDLPPTRLLSVTIDPEHDQPDILRAYGERYGAKPSRWLLATGSRQEIDRLRQAFGVFAESNGTTIDHTLATALLGPELGLIEIWRGQSGSAEDVLAGLRAATAATPPAHRGE